MSINNTKKHLVIYADDDPDDLLLVEQSFLDYSKDIELNTFPDGRHALKFLSELNRKDQVPCLIVLDINMPLMNGKKTLLELRKIKRYSKTAVVLFSTSTTLEDKMFALRNGANYISKPVNMKQMDEIIKQFASYCLNKSQKIVS